MVCLGRRVLEGYRRGGGPCGVPSQPPAQQGKTIDEILTWSTLAEYAANMRFRARAPWLVGMIGLLAADFLCVFARGELVSCVTAVVWCCAMCFC